MHPIQRAIWYSFLQWAIMFALFGLTARLAGGNAVPFVLTLGYLGVVPMLSHHYLRKYEGDRTKGAWKIGILFAIFGLMFDFAAYGYYLGYGTSYILQIMTWIYFAERVFLPPITAKWLEPHLTA